MATPPFLYHGSPVRLDRLEPRPARGVGPEHDQLTAVYATDRRDFAVAFAITPTSGAFALEVDLPDDGEPRLRFRGASPDPAGVGYVYTLPSAGFEQVSEHQWVSYTAVIPVGCETVRIADYLHWVEVVQ